MADIATLGLEVRSDQIEKGASFAFANPATALVAGSAAAVIAANIFRDELTKIIGFDIVGAAKSGVNSIVAVFVGCYHAIVNGRSALPEAFADLSIQIANNFLGGIQYMVRETVSLVNGMIISINGSLRNGFDALGLDRSGAPQFPDLGPLRNYKISQIENPYAGQAQAFDDTAVAVGSFRTYSSCRVSASRRFRVFVTMVSGAT